MSRRVVAAALILAAGLAGCARFCRGRSTADLYGLADRVWLADRWSSREVILFGTPGAERFAAKGFSWVLDGSAAAWVLPQAELRFEWKVRAARSAVLELSASPGNDAQRVAVSLNGTEIAAFDVGAALERRLFAIPPEPQRVGENRLEFAFRTSAPLSPGEVEKKAARFVSLTVGRSSDGALDDLTTRGAPGVFGSEVGSAASDVTLVGPSGVSFALALPEEAELRFAPVAHPTARSMGVRVPMRVTLESEGGGERELWRRTLEANDDPGEVRLPLPGKPGEPVRIGLHVDGEEQARFLWGVWRAPHIFGRRRVGDLEPVPFTREEDGRGDDLRRVVRGLNVILVILDAGRADHFGCYGYARPTTPEIDRIAAEGVVFDRAYTPEVYTLGAMSSIWTSEYPDRHHRGVLFLERLPADRPTLAEILRDAGITTFGAVANAMAGKVSGLDRGFGEFREVYVHPGYGSRAEVFRQGAHPWFAEHARERFFAYLHFREPHAPFDPPDSFMTLFGPNRPLTAKERIGTAWTTAVNAGRVRPTPEEIDHLTRLYDGNLAYADREVGALRSRLEADGLWERTLVIITADHGDQLDEDGYIGHSAQVREESARVPLILHFPSGRGPRGVRLKSLVDHTDLAPTIAEVMGVDLRNVKSFDGRSLLPVLSGAPGKKAVVARTVWERPVYAITDGRAKLVYETRTGEEQLHLLDTDPGERRDVGAAHPVLAAFLRQTLHHWVARLLRFPHPAPVVSAAPTPQIMTPQQCQNLCSLGYIDCASCP